MNYETRYALATATGRLEVVLKFGAIGALVAGVFILLQHGITLALIVTLLALLCLAAARILEVLTVLLHSVGRFEEQANAQRSGAATDSPPTS